MMDRDAPHISHVKYIHSSKSRSEWEQRNPYTEADHSPAVVWTNRIRGSLPSRLLQSCSDDVRLCMPHLWSFFPTRRWCLKWNSHLSTRCIVCQDQWSFLVQKECRVLLQYIFSMDPDCSNRTCVDASSIQVTHSATLILNCAVPPQLTYQTAKFSVSFSSIYEFKKLIESLGCPSVPQQTLFFLAFRPSMEVH